MFGKVLSSLITALTGGRYCVTLEIRPDGLALVASRGKSVIPFAKAADRFQSLAEFGDLAPRADGSLVVPPAKLVDIRQALQSVTVDSLDIQIPPAVEALHVMTVPDGFEVRYVWASGRLEARAAQDARHLGGGWFYAPDRCWLVEGTTPEDERWLACRFVEGADIRTLAGEVAPDWRRRGLPYVCEVTCDDRPALTAAIAQVTDEVVELGATWRVPVDSVVSVPSLPGYVLAARTLMPGVSPEVLRRGLPAVSGSCRLSGQEIPRFLRDPWPALQPFATGQAGEPLRRHRVLEATPEHILVVLRREENGLGAVEAVPTLVSGELRVEAAEVSRQLTADTEFVRFGGAWLPRAVLAGTGVGPLGRADDGRSLGPIVLSPVEVLRCGSERLEGPWARLEGLEVRLPPSGLRLETAGQHLEFLRRWRIPGGVVGSTAETLPVFSQVFAALTRQYPEGRFLVVAAKKTLDSLGPGWGGDASVRLDGGRKDPGFSTRRRGLTLATPHALEAVPALLRSSWDILCLLEADTLVRSGTSRLFGNLVDCRKSLVIGLFGGVDFLKRPAVREALSQVFGIASYGDDELLWRYGLRDPGTPAPALPSPYPLRRRAAPPVKAQPAELTLGDRPAASGLSIPPRSQGAPAPTSPWTKESTIELGGLSVRIEYGTESSAEKFVQDARRLVSYRESRASPVPFMAYWPTYDSMTRPQQRWYFHWRGQAREGKYPDTDLSYIFVHVYELLNNVGVRDPLDGYEQLRRLWLGYRERYPKLDNYLVDWITDYVLVNQCPVDALATHLDALAIDAPLRDPDQILPRFLGDSLTRLPIVLVEALSDYRVRRSKFYLDGNQELLNRVLPRSLSRVNAYLEKKVGAGVFELFRPHAAESVQRQLFQSAVYAGPARQVVATVIPYSKHPPLREFMTSLVKHTENRMRELRGYSGRLRGYSIDPAIQGVVDDFVAGLLKPIAPSPVKPRVVVDLAKAGDLVRESDELREILLGGSDKSELVALSLETRSPSGDAIPRPPGSPPNKLTDLEPVSSLLCRLDSDERRLLDVLIKGGWQVEDALLRPAFPGVLLEPLVDRVNSLALELLGDILIATEEGTRVVADDFRDELEYLSSVHEQEWQTPATSGTEPPSADLPADWAELASKLANYQIEVLRALVGEADSAVRLRQIADQHATMPELLIDSINELALDAIGDYIIEPGSNPPLIEDEDLEITRKLVATRSERLL